jgi:hypothetical protein
MEAPPHYMPPQKKSKTGLIIGIVVGAIVLCCIGPILALGGLGLWAFNNTKPLLICTFAFRDARDAVRAYAKDHNGKLPPAANWQDEVTPYYQKIIANQPKGQNPFGYMPASGVWGCENGSGGRTGMALNDEVAGQDLSQVETADSVVLFEVERATQNAHEKYVKRPESSGPKIFGNAPRGWFIIRSNGEPMLLNKGKEVPVNTGPNARD